MIFVDTNYFLRFLLDDNSEQSKIVRTLFIDAAEDKVKVITSAIVLFELYWVLSSYYNKDRKSVGDILQKVLDLDFIEFDQQKIFTPALKLYGKTNLSLEDCYNFYFARSQSAQNFATFDVKLKKLWKQKQSSLC